MCFLFSLFFSRFIIVLAALEWCPNFFLSQLHYNSGGTSTKAIWSRPRQLIRNENPPKISFGPTKTN